MQKGSAQLLLIILVLFAVVGGYLYLNQSKSSINISPIINKVATQVSSIQTYKNLEFNFQYSEDEIVKEDTEKEFNQRAAGSTSKSVGDFRKNFKGYVMYEPGKFLSGVVVLGKDGSYDTNPFTLWVFDNPDNITIDSWFDKYWYYPFLWGVFDYVSKGHVTLDKEATISGMMSKYKIVSYQPGAPKYVYISKNGKMYLFRIIGETGDKILSTFKFLK